MVIDDFLPTGNPGKSRKRSVLGIFGASSAAIKYPLSNFFNTGEAKSLLKLDAYRGEKMGKKY